MMMEKNQEPFRDLDSDDLDHALDSVLEKYAAVEPRPGLEDRIFANLRAEKAHPQQYSWWRWSWAVAAAVVMVAALLAWRSTRSSHPVIANHPAVENDSGKPVQHVASGQIKPGPSPRRRSGPRPSTQPHLATVETYPKLDVFPSPRPLSEEELALARYVRNFPTDAQAVAQAQEASEREVLAKMQALATESGQSN